MTEYGILLGASALVIKISMMYHIILSFSSVMACFEGGLYCSLADIVCYYLDIGSLPTRACTYGINQKRLEHSGTKHSKQRP
ncbi:hypothetical protein BDW66DRAFT_77818 [Aspergillus desertorum]